MAEMKMKKIFFLCAASVAMLSFSGCTDDINYGLDGEGEGRLLVKAELHSDVKVVSRAAVSDDALAETAILWIANSKGVVRDYKGFSTVPAEGIKLAADNYKAIAWAGDSVPASFDKKYYRGEEPFVISAGQTVAVNLVCKIVNSAVEVRYDDAVDDGLSDYTLTVGHKAGSLTYNGREDAYKPGYFMMPSFDKNLKCTLTGKLADGSEYTWEKEITDAKSGTKYILNVVNHQDNPEEFGGALFGIEVVEEPIVVEDVVEISTAPIIEALNFDLATPVVGEEGKLTEKKLWVRSTSALSKVEIACPTLADALGIGGGDFEIFGMQPAVAEALASKGFTYQHFTHKDDAENPDFEEMKITFGDNFMNLIPKGEHRITVRATDENGRTGVASFDVILTDAMIRTDAVAADAVTTWATKATVNGTVLKDGVSNLGINYRKAGTQQWQLVAFEGNVAVGATYAVELTALEPGTTYEYQAVCDQYTAELLTFTTETPAQLPNASFEDWSQPGKPYLPYADAAQAFWDSGNHGATTLSAKSNLTTPSTDKVHSGTYSARLRSDFVGIGSIGKFAAGNIFVGKYIATVDMNGILGWGRSFTSRPKALRGYVHYTPASVTHDNVNAPDIVKGQPDRGIIYMALVDGTTQSYEGEEWGCVVKTNPSDSNYFDKNGSNVIAYGEKVLDGTTPGDDLVEFEIPLDYKITDKKPSRIILVCSASKGGDYFAGGKGSVMYIDDFELVY